MAEVFNNIIMAEGMTGECPSGLDTKDIKSLGESSMFTTEMERQLENMVNCLDQTRLIGLIKELLAAKEYEIIEEQVLDDEEKLSFGQYLGDIKIRYKDNGYEEELMIRKVEGQYLFFPPDQKKGLSYPEFLGHIK